MSNDNYSGYVSKFSQLLMVFYRLAGWVSAVCLSGQTVLMTFALMMTLVAVILIAIGIIGIIYPVLPGSLAVLVGVLVWSFSVRTAEGWWLLALGGSITVAGMLAQIFLTGKTLKMRRIPQRSVFFGVIGAMTGMFLIPIVGIFIGFALGLLASEWARQRDLAVALADTLAALRSMGLGILVELAAALTTGTIFTVCVLIYVITA